jgi:hypothetical protein
MRTIFLLLVLSISVFGYSQVTKIINVETAGSLSSILTEVEKTTITDLTVSGTIDARDIKCMRDQIAHITNLDLSNANIAAYEGTATSSLTTSYPANEMPRASFYRSGSSTSTTPLASIILPNSLTSIGANAFYLCTYLKSIYIGNSITNIGIEAYEGCSGLTTVTMGNSVTTIQNNAFHYCSALSNLTLSESITSLGEDVFSDCKIEKVTFPKSLTTISDTFRSNDYLTEVTLPASIKKISNWAFEYCNALKTIYSLNTIPPVCESYSFAVVPNVTAVYVPASSVSAYKNAPVWGDYFYSQIKAMPTSGTVDLKINKVEIYSSNSDIVIDKTSKGEMVRVFTLTGQLFNIVESTGDKIIIPALKDNIYIVKTATKTIKVFIQEY